MITAALPRRPQLRFTSLGFGAAPGGNLFRAIDDDTFAAAVDSAWNAGVRYFDTAPHYGLGLSERRLGAALRGRPRDSYLVSTKVGRLLVPAPGAAPGRDPEGFDVPATHRRVWDFSRDGVRRSLEASLQRSGLDHFDVVYLHDPDEHLTQAVTEALPALTELRDQGVIGAVGAGMNQSPMLARFVRETDIDLVMCAGRYTLLDQRAAHDLLPAAQQHGVGVVVAGVYNSGVLATDQPQEDATYDYGPAPAEILRRARHIAAICAEHGVTLPEAALAFVRGHPAVVSTVVGLRSPAEVGEAAHRAAAAVPDTLWPALHAAGLVQPAT
ncbi:aldo/keto reductase [Dactylosporangium matsuzakiense]|uniref:Oxidoreductase n=1 Tax=Dactylosporangium matsuzakiense TaxID=53360 RepID=A0A9W6NTG7_9ACTN|nr:aldo/keto reductase [Dactylosporangium matsuzakiense]UWZ48493.1 aldo/keto reductase [Dactylosporangium matsuzakiense]GLL08714.1 oxidoreductase [Dactylosporangium matsuzakiense]